MCCLFVRSLKKEAFAYVSENSLDVSNEITSSDNFITYLHTGVYYSGNTMTFEALEVLQLCSRWPGKF